MVLVIVVYNLRIISFSGNFLWEDLGGPEKDHDSGTAIVLRLAIIYHSRGFSIRGIPSHHQMVWYSWAGAVVGVQVGLMVIDLVQVGFTLVLVHHFLCFQNGTSGNSSSLLPRRCLPRKTWMPS